MTRLQNGKRLTDRGQTRGSKVGRVMDRLKFEVNRCKLFIQTIQQQGPTVKRRELCSVFSDKVSWK